METNKNNWFDKLDRTFENTVRCFVSLCNQNPLDNEKLIVANIWSRSENERHETRYFEYSSGNIYRYAIPCEDAIPVFFNEYLISIENNVNKASFDGFINFICTKEIDGSFFVPNMEQRINDLILKALSNDH